jgi:hypothetical protein
MSTVSLLAGMCHTQEPSRSLNSCVQDRSGGAPDSDSAFELLVMASVQHSLFFVCAAEMVLRPAVDFEFAAACWLLLIIITLSSCEPTILFSGWILSCQGNTGNQNLDIMLQRLSKVCLCSCLSEHEDSAFTTDIRIVHQH